MDPFSAAGNPADAGTAGAAGSGLVSDRLERLGDYPFARLSRLLAGLAPGRPVINMAVGEPQDPPPALIAATLAEKAEAWGRYPPLAGTESFRWAVAGWLNRRYGLPEGWLDPDASLLPLAGTREGLFQAALLSVSELRDRPEPRPAVLMPNPFYAVYEGAAVIAGAEPVFLPCTAATGYLPDLEALPSALLRRTALFYLCSPANPQGVVASAAYLGRALALARQHGFVLAVDECYSEIYDSEPPPGILAVAAQEAGRESRTEKNRAAIWANLLVFNSLSKRSSAAGLRSGFVAGDPSLIQAFQRLRSYAAAGTPLPALAAAAALWNDDAHVIEIRAGYRQRIDVAQQELGGRFGFQRPAGGFFAWLAVGDGEAAARKLWQEEGVRVLPGGYLGRTVADGTHPGAGFIRVALVHDLETVREGCRRLRRCLES